MTKEERLEAKTKLIHDLRTPTSYFDKKVRITVLQKIPYPQRDAEWETIKEIEVGTVQELIHMLLGEYE